MPPDKLFGLDISILATGLSIVIAALLMAIARVFGKRTKETPSHVELAGAVIDNRVAEKLVRALDDNTRASRDTATGVVAIVGEVKATKSEMHAAKNELVEVNQRLERVERIAEIVKDRTAR